MRALKYFKCECCGKELRESRENFVWFKNADESGNWHRPTCRTCEANKILEENVLEKDGVKYYKCFICNKWFPADSFDKHGGNDGTYSYRDGLDKRCHSCKIQQNKNARSKYSDEKRLETVLQFRWLGAKERAERKGLLFDITKEDLINLWDKQNGKCAISGIDMTYTLDSGRTPYNVSVDQINPSMGYTKNNIQLVCMSVNQLKSDFEMDIVLNICKNIINNNKDE